MPVSQPRNAFNREALVCRVDVFYDALSKYRKIPIISPGLIFVQKASLAELIFGGAYFRRGLLSEGILRFKMGLACQFKQLKTHLT